MFTPNQSGITITRGLFMTTAFDLLCKWWKLGIRDCEAITSTLILESIVPGIGTGTRVQHQWIDEVCRQWEDLYETPITDLSPNLPTGRPRLVVV